MTVMAEGAEERGERGKEVKYHNPLFYVDDIMVAFSEPQWLQGAFSTLVRLFYRVGLRTNVGKTISMVCCPCQAAGNQSKAAHGIRMTGEGPSYWEKHKGQVQCRYYGEDMSAGSFAGHRMTQQGRASEERLSWKT